MGTSVTPCVKIVRPELRERILPNTSGVTLAILLSGGGAMIVHDQDRRPSEDDGRREDLVATPAGGEESACSPGHDEVDEYLRAQMEEAAKWLTD
jgi:hypothetical protein